MQRILKRLFFVALLACATSAFSKSSYTAAKLLSLFREQYSVGKHYNLDGLVVFGFTSRCNESTHYRNAFVETVATYYASKGSESAPLVLAFLELQNHGEKGRAQADKILTQLLKQTKNTALRNALQSMVMPAPMAVSPSKTKHTAAAKTPDTTATTPAQSTVMVDPPPKTDDEPKAVEPKKLNFIFQSD